MNYRPNHLNMLSVTAKNRTRFPAYPSPWFLILDDRGVILGDGLTPDEAEIDFALGRDPNTPSPQATVRLSYLERQARKVRKARRQKRAENAQKIAPTSYLLAGLPARDAESTSKPAVVADRQSTTAHVDAIDAEIDALQDKIIDDLINAQIDAARQKMIDKARQCVIDDAINSLEKRKNGPETEILSSTNPSRPT